MPNLIGENLAARLPEAYAWWVPTADNRTFAAGGPSVSATLYTDQENPR